MAYSIYQINLTKFERAAVNAMNNPHRDHPKYRSFISSHFNEWDKVEGKFYEKVAEINADDLEHVFEIGNIGPEASITRIAPMHSISVGDIIVDDQNNKQWAVQSFGFKEISILEISK